MKKTRTPPKTGGVYDLPRARRGARERVRGAVGGGCPQPAAREPDAVVLLARDRPRGAARVDRAAPALVREFRPRAYPDPCHRGELRGAGCVRQAGRCSAAVPRRGHGAGRLGRGSAYSGACQPHRFRYVLSLVLRLFATVKDVVSRNACVSIDLLSADLVRRGQSGPHRRDGSAACAISTNSPFPAVAELADPKPAGCGWCDAVSTCKAQSLSGKSEEYD